MRLISTLFIALCCLTVSTLWGQRLDGNDFSYTSLRLPLEPLEGQFTTYSVRIDPGSLNLAQIGMLESQMTQAYFDFAAYEQKPSEGDFELVVQLDGDNLVSREIVSKEVTRGRGDNARKVTVYSYVVKFRTPITYQLLDGKRQIMRESIYSGYDSLIEKNFGEENTRSALQSAWEANGNVTLEGWLKETYAARLRSLGAYLQSQLDTRSVTQPMTFYGIKRADKINYEDMAELIPQLKTTIEAATVEAPLTIEAFADFLPIWENALANADPDDRRESIAFQAAAVNLGKVYALTGDFDQARSYLNRFGEADRRNYLAQPLAELITDLENRQAANVNIPQTFVGTFDPRSATVAISPAPEPATEQFLVLTGSLDTLRGVITYDYKVRDSYQTLEHVQLEDATNPSEAVRLFQPEEVLYIRKDEKDYIPVRISIGPLSITNIQELIYANTGMALSRFESDGDFDYCVTYVEENRRGEKIRETLALTNPLANLNRVLVRRFADCPTISQKAAAESYEETETSFRQIVDDYAGCQE
jgi:tetratricopeptide (TPR) repeat protein